MSEAWARCRELVARAETLERERADLAAALGWIEALLSRPEAWEDPRGLLGVIRAEVRAALKGAGDGAG